MTNSAQLVLGVLPAIPPLPPVTLNARREQFQQQRFAGGARAPAVGNSAQEVARALYSLSPRDVESLQVALQQDGFSQAGVTRRGAPPPSPLSPRPSQVRGVVPGDN